MSIRPIDIVTIAPKSQEASQLQASQAARNEQSLAHIGEAFSREMEREREQTIKPNKSEKEEYNFDPREQSRNSYPYSGKKKKKTKETESKKAEDMENSHIDIKI